VVIAMTVVMAVMAMNDRRNSFFSYTRSADNRIGDCGDRDRGDRDRGDRDRGDRDRGDRGDRSE